MGGLVGPGHDLVVADPMGSTSEGFAAVPLCQRGVRQLIAENH